jgi:hypothetical protein
VRRILLGLLGSVALAGCGAPPTAPASEMTLRPPQALPTDLMPQMTMPPVTCSADGVGFSSVAADAAMGVRVLTFEMVNCGTRAFGVNGYPGIRLFDKESKPIDVTVGQGSASVASVPEFDAPAGKVTLAPGEKARSGLVWRNLVTESNVVATTAVTLEASVVPGKSWHPVPLVVPDAVRGATTVTIDLGNTTKIGVQAWSKA